MFNLLLIIAFTLTNFGYAQQILPRIDSGSGPFSNTSIFHNGTLAPYVRNVSADYAWVVPRSKFDFGARDMVCECFDPADSCCMPVSTAVAPYCISGNATCCGNTYCEAGETCCGGACCPSSTSCVLTSNKDPGCCPLHTVCSGSPSCLDNHSPTCTAQSSHPAQCCPASLPTCGSFSDGGQACYASAPPAKTAGPVESTSGVSTTDSSTTQALLATTYVQYETLTLIPDKNGGYIYAMPSLSPNEISVSGIVAATSWAVVVLPSAPPSIASSTVFSNSSFPVTSSSTTTSHANQIISTSTAPGLNVNPVSSTTASALCFDTDLEKDLPCSASSISSSPASGAGGYNPAGATTVGSGSRPKVANIGWKHVFLGLVLLLGGWW